MAKLTLNDIVSLANTASAKEALNDNFSAIESALENTLSRDGASPNQMTADIDMNDNDLLNVKRVDADEIYKNGVPFEQFVAYGNKLYQILSGTGSQTNFTLLQDPGSLGNLVVILSGLQQRPGIDFTYSGTTLTFIAAPPNATNNILVRYDQALPTGVTDSGSVNFTQAGANAVLRNSQAKLREHVSVEDFGAVGDGVIDDTVAIQRGENAVAAAGGGVLLFKSTRYKVTALLTKRASNVLWKGRGTGHQHDVGSGNDAATGLEWAGAAGGTMIEFAPTEGASARRISGGGIVDIALYGNGSAAKGLVMKSVNDADIDIYGDNFTGTVMEVGVATTLGEARDTQQNRIRLFFQQVGASSGKALTLGGDTTANTSANKIHLRGAYKNSTALELINCDNNEIYQWTFRFGGGTGLGVDSLGGASAAVTARANTWTYIYAGDGGVRLRGTGDGYTVASTRNRFLMWDNDNSQPMPVVGTGCDYMMIDHDGTIRWTDLYIKRAQANRMEVFGGTDDKLWRWNFVTDADSFIAASHGTGTISLNSASDTASNVGFGLSTKGTGPGALYANNFGTAPFQWDWSGSAPRIGFYGTAPIAKPTITGSRGGNTALATLLQELANLGLILNGTTV